MYTETELIQSVIKGEAHAHRRFVKQYERLVFYVIHKLIDDEDDVKDLAQDVFMKVFKNLPKFKEESKLSTWIGQIAYRESVNFLKKKKRHYHVSTEESETLQLSDNRFTPEESAISEDTSSIVKSAINRLPERYRQVLVLYHLDEFSYPEIGEMTNMPEGTVKNYIFRARKMLKEQLSSMFKNEIT